METTSSAILENAGWEGAPRRTPVRDAGETLCSSAVPVRKPQTHVPWSEREMNILRTNRRMTSRRLMRILPGRTEKAISNKRENSDLHFFAWTGAEVLQLRELAPQHFPAQVARIMSMPEHWIRRRAGELKLTFKSRTDTTRRTGNHILDAIIVRCMEDNISMVGLDRELNTNTYFAVDIFGKRAKALNPNLAHVAKAIAFFGGRGLMIDDDANITIDWNDE